MKRWKWVALFCLVGVLLLAGLIAFVLPGIVKNQAVRRVEAATGRKLVIGGLSINPFTLTVTARDLRFSERGSAETFAAFSSARIAFSPASLIRRGPVVAAARLTAPRLHIVRAGANRYNFTDLLKFLPRRPRLSVSNLTVHHGSVDFLDQGLPVAKRHELRQVELAVPFVTTMPRYADRFVSPRLSGVLNGSPFHLEGRLRPFPRAAEATATVDITDASLPYYLSYLPMPLPVRVASGSISTRLALNYRVAPGKTPELSLSGSLALAGLKVADRAGSPLLSATRLEAGIAGARLPSGNLDLGSLAADGLELFLKRDQAGVWSHTRLLSAPSPGDASRRTPLVSVQQARLKNGRLHFTDSLPPGGFSSDLAGIALDLRDFSSAPGKRASYALSFTTSRGDQAEMKGDFSARPFTSSSQVRLSAVPLEAYYPYLAWAERAEVTGRFNFSGDLDFGPQEFKLDQVSVQARPFATLVGRKTRITGSALSLEGGKYSREEKLVQVADARLSGGEIRLSRARTGGLLPLARTGEIGKKPATRVRYRIGHISGSGMKALFCDEKLATRPCFRLEKVAFSLDKLAGPNFGPTPFRATAVYRAGGSLSASGRVSQTPWTWQGELAAQRLPLADLSPYLPERLNLTVANGSGDARLAGTLVAREGRLSGSYGGSVGLHSVRLVGPDGGNFLKLESLQLDRMKVGLDPREIDIGALALTRFSTRIVVAEDGSLNLQRLYAPGAGGKELPGAATGVKQQVRIAVLTMQDGTLSFIDHHVPGGYATTLNHLGGRISGLSSEENRFADLDLRGDLENRSPLRITGRINPLRQDLFADLKASFTDIELPPMTPYSGTYLGYAVDRGQLSVESRYRIVNRKLDSENHVLIEQLDLGKRIESDRATTLPIRLAVALLKDRKGEIRLDLPVMGQTDDPHFSLWGVIVKVLKGLVVKAASSPMALLQALFGAKDQEFGSVAFAPGSAALSPEGREKLKKLAAALNDRPALKVKIVGAVDPERDAEGYRSEFLLQKMRSQKFHSLGKAGKNKPGDAPETLQIGPEEYARYLKAVYDSEEFPKPRNFLGLVKSLPEAEMKRLILAHIVVGEEQLRHLAEARVAAVRAFLVGEGGIAPGRVVPGSVKDKRAAATGGTPGSRVELEVEAD